MNQFETAVSPALDRQQRLAVGAIYGLLLGMVYALVAGTIDVIVLRHLPLRVDWARVWGDMLLTGGAGAVLGGVAAWPEEAWKGIGLGAATIAGWSLLRSFMLLHLGAVVLVVLMLPLVVLSAPVVVALRFAVHQYERNRRTAGWQRWRAQLLLGLALAALSAFAGSWSQMTPATQAAVERVHRLLQQTLAHPTQPLPSVLSNVPDLRYHLGPVYWLNQRPSDIFPAGVDVRVTFDTGYSMTCVVDSDEGEALYCNPD